VQRLLADITAGWVDIMVVYKIDRLTRSLRFKRHTRGQRRRAVCRTGQARRRQPILFHAARSPQLSRPDITQAILDGRRPHGLTADKLLAHSLSPAGLAEQRIVLGFA